MSAPPPPDVAAPPNVLAARYFYPFRAPGDRENAEVRRPAAMSVMFPDPRAAEWEDARYRAMHLDDRFSLVAVQWAGGRFDGYPEDLPESRPLRRPGYL